MPGEKPCKVLLLYSKRSPGKRLFAPRPFLLFSFIIYHSAAPPFPPRPASFCQKSLAIRRKDLYNKCVKHVD